MSNTRTGYFIVALLALAGCGDDIGSGVGLIEGFIADPLTASFSGDLNGDVQVSISDDGTTWVDLGSLNGITVPLQTNDLRTTVHGGQTVPVGSYSRIRVTMSEVDARLNGGSSIGNTFLPGNTDVPLGGSDDLVELILQVSSFEVRATDAERIAITVTMNSESWMTEAALQAGTVEDAVIQAAVTATAAVEARP